MIILLLGLLAVVSAGSNPDNKDSFKNQFRSGHSRKHKGSHDVTNFSTENCTDPRTMKKHPAYTEWADAYSCTRHRCQPGGRNLAIYTVGCKRVEAPESAIECEEVVEDTNMQFPFCCTRLRCLVVVRGEVWTRVLGQPWEVLPAAPWSHMYKMKKPPPDDTTFIPKTVEQGPIYELTDNESGSEQGSHDKVLLRTSKNTGSASGDQPETRSALPSPDIIALTTNNEGKSTTTQSPESSSRSTHSKSRHNKRRLQQTPDQYFEEDVEKEKEKQAEQVNLEIEELPTSTEKPVEEEVTGKENEKAKFVGNSYNNYPVTEKPSHKSHRRESTPGPLVWTEIPIGQWNEPKEGDNLIEPRVNEHHNNENNNNEEPQLPPQREPKHEALQIPAKKETAEARDTKPNNLQALVDAIGSRMRDIESVVQKMSDKVQLVKTTTEGSAEKRLSAEGDGSHTQHGYMEYKRPSAEDENYKSDASNSILRRSPPKPPKEPPPTYMAPVVEKHRKAVEIEISEPAEDSEKKHKKHAHKKKRTKSAHIHKKRSRSKEDRRKHFNKLSAEAEKNAVSVDDSSGIMQ